MTKNGLKIHTVHKHNFYSSLFLQVLFSFFIDFLGKLIQTEGTFLTWYFEAVIQQVH